MMKIILFIIISLLTGCVVQNNSKEDDINKFLDNIKSDEVILSREEIAIYNENIANKTDTLYDLNTYDKLSKDEIKNIINRYSMPVIPKYDGNKAISLVMTYEIEDNKNLLETDDLTTIPRGLVVNRSNLRSYPTNIHFFDKLNTHEFDRLQETEVPLNTPCLVIHESKDRLWYFIITPYYTGWIEKKNVGFPREEDYRHFIENENYITITVDVIKKDGHILDMGSSFPLLEERNGDFIIEIPIVLKNKIERKKISIPKNKATKKHLSYTPENVIKEALQYLKTPYSWGGLDYGIDCSGLIRNIYKVFGFNLPRNTFSASTSLEKSIDLSNMDNREKLLLFEEHIPCLLYKEGHVMLYIGLDHIIHASSKEKEVTLTDLKTIEETLTDIKKMIMIAK